MFDFNDAEQIQKLSCDLVAFAKEYATARNKEAEAKFKINILLSANFDKLREKKSNVGHEIALVMLIELVPEAKDHYKEMLYWEGRYKGLEKILDAMNSQLILAMSLIKNQQKES